jgi:hypothetical protein
MRHVTVRVRHARDRVEHGRDPMEHGRDPMEHGRVPMEHGQDRVPEAVRLVGPGDFLGFPTPSVAHHLRNPFTEDFVYPPAGRGGGVPGPHAGPGAVGT